MDIFTKLHYDTNHWLYTLFMYLSGPNSSWAAYRMPSLAAGMLSVLLLALIARRESSRHALLACLLSGASFLMIVYSSEARGYSCLVFFSLASYYFLYRYCSRADIFSAFSFSICAVLGFLSHLTFIFPYAGFLAWSGLKFLRSSRRPLQVLGHMAKCHLLPVLFFAGLYFIDIRYMGHGGAPDNPVWLTIQSMVAQSFGIPAVGILSLLFLPGLFALAFYEIFRVWKEGSEIWAFYLVAIFMAPAAVIFFHRSSGLFNWTERHFLVCLPFFLLLAVRFLMRGIESNNKIMKLLCWTFIVLYIVGNGIYIADFLRYGRGQYRKAVEFMAARTETEIISVGGDQDFRDSMVLDYYDRYLQAGRRFAYHMQILWPEEGADWFFAHSFDRHPPVVPETFSLRGVRYKLVGFFPYSGISGWHWFLFRRQPITQ